MADFRDTHTAIGDGDVILGVRAAAGEDPTDADLRRSAGAALFAWLLANHFPSDLTGPQKLAIRGALDLINIPALPEDGRNYTLRGSDREGSGGRLDPIFFWQLAAEVPSGPATQSGIGRVLTIIGTGDRDYAWRDLGDALAAYLARNPITIEQRVLVDVPASEDTRDKLIVEDSQIYTTIDRVVHEQTPADAEFETIRFDLGYFSDESALDARFYRPGRFYYNFAKYTPRVVRYVSGNSGPKEWQDGDAADLVANITADVGHFPTDEEATPHVAAVGNVYYNEQLRTYRRVTSFTAGAGPVRQPQRLRQANEDDVARLDDDLGTYTTRMQASPEVINKDDIADEYTFSLWTLPGRYSGATTARVKFLTAAVAPGESEFPYDPNRSVHRFTVTLTDDQKAFARRAGVGTRIPAFIDLLDDEGAALPRFDVEGVVQGQASVSLTVVPGPRIGTRQVSDIVNDLVGRAADLSIVRPQGWETAEGAGVGISLTRAVVADVTALSYQPKVTIPADANPGDDFFIYLAVPSGSELSDWRVDLAGFAAYPGFSFGQVGVDGENTVYSYLFTVGDGQSGGFSSGTAPGAMLTLQHHGTEPHTAYGGDLIGRALAQVTGLIMAAVSGGATAIVQATERALGGVRGATQAQAEADAGNVILGWSLNRLKTVISRTESASALTTAQQTGLLHVDASPPTLQFLHPDELKGRTLTMLVDAPERVTGDAWFERYLNGTRIGAGRTRWTENTNSIDFVIPASDSPADRSVRNQVATTIRTVGTILETRFYDAVDGGNLLNDIRVSVGGAQAPFPSILASHQAYEDTRKTGNHLYLWPDSEEVVSGRNVRTPGGIAIGGTVVARNEHLTTAQAERVIRRAGDDDVYAIPDAGAVTWNVDLGVTARLTLGGARRQILNPVNVQTGDVLFLELVQDGTGGREVLWGNAFAWVGGSAPVLSSAANASDFFEFRAMSPNRLVGWKIGS